jgi:hypothetical protein
LKLSLPFAVTNTTDPLTYTAQTFEDQPPMPI